jgi:hypothetical protein
MQDLKETEPLVAIELALTRLTNGLGGMQLLRVLERVSDKRRGLALFFLTVGPSSSPDPWIAQNCPAVAVVSQ